MRAIVHSVKHYVQMTLSTVATVTLVTNTLVSAVESTVANLGSEVEEGALVKNVFIELWIIGGSSDEFFTITLEKQSGGLGTMTFAQSTDLFTYANKKNILYTTQGLASNDGIGNPQRIMYGWYKIPKGKQRFGLTDKLKLNISSRGADEIKFCGFATYKEYS